VYQHGTRRIFVVFDIGVVQGDMSRKTNLAYIGQKYRAVYVMIQELFIVAGDIK
jgi:hypothetical protein